MSMIKAKFGDFRRSCAKANFAGQISRGEFHAPLFGPSFLNFSLGVQQWSRFDRPAIGVFRAFLMRVFRSFASMSEIRASFNKGVSGFCFRRVSCFPLCTSCVSLQG
jgi:hypothetical protein